MIKLLHTADIHLDTPFLIGDAAKAQVLRNECRGMFSSMITYARIEKYDLVLIAGDMLDHDYVTDDTVSLIMREFEASRDIKFVITPGNHDPFTADSIWAKADFPDNVYIFRDESLGCYRFDDLGVDVYGYAFTSVRMEHCPFSEPPKLDKSRINILVAHGSLGEREKEYCPIKHDYIYESGFDYVALGHVHNSDGIAEHGKIRYGYSGAPTGHSFDECGEKGVICVSMKKENGIFETAVKGKRFSRRRFECLSLDLSGAADDTDMLVRIDRALVQNGYGEDTLLKLELIGEISPEITLSESDIAKHLSKKLFFTDIKNKTLPLFMRERLENDPTVRGKFYRALLPALMSENEEERYVAAEALRLGLAALAEK